MLKFEKFEDQIFFTTVRISTKNSEVESIGTGFLYIVPIIPQKQHALLLISNRHVFSGASQVFLNFSKRHSKENRPLFAKQIPVRIENLSVMYHEHPDKNVDLACLNVSWLENDKKQRPFYKNLYPEARATFEEDQLTAGRQVYFVGYPDNRLDVAHNLPILRSGVIASIPKVDFNKQKQFLIDAQVFPGSSGSPVFCDVDGVFKLVGIVSQTMIKHQELQTIEAVDSKVVQQVLGLGIVIKATEIDAMVSPIVEALKSQLESK